ncbi:unnamed protein product, partial [marine sediment metagenome]
MRKFIAIILVVIFPYCLCYGKGAGSTAAQFLCIQPGARPSGMGEVHVSVIGDGNSLYWNPAGLGYLDNAEICFTHMVYFQELNYNFISYCKPFSDLGTFSIGGITLYSGDIPKTSEDTLGNYVDTGETFTTLETAVIFGWGKKINSKLS